MTASSGNGLDLSGLTRILRGACAAMIASIDEFTHADQVVGDGDHGLAIGRGFHAADAFLSSRVHTDVGELLEGMGTAMLTSMGGASGAIYGTLFRRGGHALIGRPSFDAEALANFLEEGLAGVTARGGALPGDKTIVDAIGPAATAARTSIGLPLADALIAVSLAATQGADSTKGMLASQGRARTLGERALGHVDPGALSFATLLGQFQRIAAEG